MILANMREMGILGPFRALLIILGNHDSVHSRLPKRPPAEPIDQAKLSISSIEIKEPTTFKIRNIPGRGSKERILIRF